MQIPEGVFRAYDIRGIAGVELTPAFARALGQAIGTEVQGDVVVGRDHRSSGGELADALTEGLLATGCNVTRIGVTPTPVGYWYLKQFDLDAGVHITGSHNPSEYNGFKITYRAGSVFGDALLGLAQRMQEGGFAQGKGRVTTADAISTYLRDLTRGLRRVRPLKVVVDAGNGTGGLTAVPLYRAMGAQVVPLYCEPDGTFPNHHPDPTVLENLADLRVAVREHGADLGIALDGDGDRLGVVDRDGRVLWGDQLMILFARDVLREVPGATIIGEVKCSKTLYDDIRARGGRPVMWKTGHSFIKTRMRELNSPLAGEMSGHIFFGHRYYGFDDATYAGARLLEIADRTEGSLAELLHDVPRMHATPELRFPCSEAEKFAWVQRVHAHFCAAGAAVIDIDGVRVEWADGWGLVRPSNTQPLLVLRFEATTAARLQEIRTTFERALDACR
jgi:phosphomannomutase/phosphoglucomutase